jgi:C1A family cysteine protease
MKIGKYMSEWDPWGSMYFPEKEKDLTKHGYGRIADLGDDRDKRFSILEGLSLPSSVDLRPDCAPIEDQGQLGSCTSFAAGAAIRYARKKQGLADFVTSHLFLYYYSRSKSTKTVDAGATIRDTIKAAAKTGDCPEIDWPYIIDHFDIHPPIQATQDALKDRAISYLSVAQDLTQMKNCLAQGFPIVVGFTVYSSFESNAVAQSGVVPMPGRGESVLGGHAVLVVGYNDAKQQFTCRNSWSDQWGDQGYFYMPYAYLLNKRLASDFWTVRAMNV